MMKKIYVVIVLISIVVSAYSQVPVQLSYQSVIRNAAGKTIADELVGMRTSILQGSATGTVVYAETHSDSTNSNGLLTVSVGNGTTLNGVFEEIDWSNGPYFLEQGVDPSGGTNYSVIETIEILSVPYAHYARVADTVIRVIDTSSVNELQTISKSGLTVTLSDNGGNFSDSILTEAQVDTFVANNGFLTAEMDGDTTNELQELTASSSGDTVYLSKTNSVIIPGVSDANIPIRYGDDVIYHDTVYKTVWIGNQLWFAENLRTTKYNDGVSITVEGSYLIWTLISTEAMCYYDNNSSQVNTYGALYNWYAVETGKLCPTGWHVPTDAEWTVLTDTLGGLSEAGGKLKEKGTDYWMSASTGENTGATDQVGFAARGGGHRQSDNNGRFSGKKGTGYWWSSTSDNPGYSAWYRSMQASDVQVEKFSGDCRKGFSVRCLKDN